MNHRIRSLGSISENPCCEIPLIGFGGLCILGLDWNEYNRMYINKCDC